MTKVGPWFKFYASAWQGDIALKKCSLAARGLWIEMICVMSDAQPYGYLADAGGPMTLDTLALLIGRPLAEVEIAYAELEARGVFSKASIRTKGPKIAYARRMVKCAKNAENGRQGGISNQLKIKEKQNSLKQNPKPRRQKTDLDLPSLDTAHKWQQCEGGLGGECTQTPSLKTIAERGTTAPRAAPTDQDAAKPGAPQATRGRAKQIKTRLPEPWEPTLSMTNYARNQGFNNEEIGRIATRFSRYWRSSDTPRREKSDWDTTWKNWVDREYRPRRSPATDRASGTAYLADIAGLTPPDQPDDRDDGGCLGGVVLVHPH
jgi:hypothetical protein